MKKFINVLCVLILALTFIDLGYTLFAPAKSTVSIDLTSLSTGELIFLLVVALLTLFAIVVCFVTFIRFILNVNRNQVFTEKNVNLLRMYGLCTLVIGVCLIAIVYMTKLESSGFDFTTLDIFIEGFFALLMGEVFSYGMKLKEHKG